MLWLLLPQAFFANLLCISTSPWLQLSGDAVLLSTIREESEPRSSHGSHDDTDGTSPDTVHTAESHAMMERREDLNRDLADLNGRLEDAEAYRKQLMQSTDSWDTIKVKYEVGTFASHVHTLNQHYLPLSIDIHYHQPRPDATNI